MKETFSLKITLVKAINKNSHIKMKKKKPQKKFIFGKIAIGKKQPVTLVKKFFACNFQNNKKVC